MNRKIIWLHHIWIIVVLIIVHADYENTVISARLGMPSNQRVENNYEWIEGRITAFNFEDYKIDFKTKQGDKILIDYIPPDEFNNILIGPYYGRLLINTSSPQWLSQKVTGTFDYDRYLYSEGYSGKYAFNQFEPVGKTNLPLKLRVGIHERVVKMPSSKLKDLMLSLFFGYDKRLTETPQFQALGIYHLFAISGLHFGIIYLISRKATIIGNIKVKALITMLILYLFYILIDGGISSIRAMVMCLYLLIGNLLKRPIDRYCILAVTNIIVLSLNPKIILGSGYLLSFYAYIVVSLILPGLLEFITKYKIFQNRILKMFITSLGVQIALLPVSMYVFGEVNIYGFVANMIMIPVFSGLLPILILILTIYCITGVAFGGNLINQIIQWILTGVGYLPLNTSSIFQFTTPELFIIIAMGMVFSLFLSFTYFRKNISKYAKYIVTVGILTLICIGASQNSNDLEIYAIDVGHGDSTLIDYKGNHILIDVGGAYSNVIDFLKRQQIKTIDLVILTHAHQDHIGGFENLDSSFYISRVICLKDVADMLESNSSHTFEILDDQGLNISVESLNLRVIPINSQDENSTYDPNNRALLTLLNFESFDAVFTADISGDMIEALDILPIDIDLLKMPHHGSKTGMFDILWETHQVDLAYSSHNRKYYMPNADLVASYLSNGVAVYDTFMQGTLHFKVKHDNIRIVDYYRNQSIVKYD